MSDTPSDFIRDMIRRDLAAGRNGGRVVTRFPPEPNGYLHIGHAKAITLGFSLAREFDGVCHLRFDDTNPLAEEQEFVDAIQGDVRWLGFDWGDKLFFASEYFERLCAYAVQLIEQGQAYVCEQSEEEMRATRGTVTEPGRPSPWRDRPVAESLDLFARMKAGEFPDGAMTLRAKIDMAHPNMKMRDPAIYRIRHAHHQHVGATWCIYPLYDFAHCLSDAIEGITHSLCTLEFEVNRPLYDWYLDQVLPPGDRPYQTEFARLEVASIMTSKRKLRALVEEGRVAGWDDPRMPTIAGLRRRGFTPEAIVAFCERVGVAKANSTVEMELLDFHVRDDLNHRAPRVMGVVDPLPLVIENYPAGRTETLSLRSAPPEDDEPLLRDVPFSGELLIDRSDFAEEPPKGWKRLAPGGEIRLRGAYFVTCTGVDKDEAGRITAVRCTYDPATRGGSAPDGRKVPGTIHWVSAPTAVPVEYRLYDRLFAVDSPGAERDFREDLNPDSLRVSAGFIEPAAVGAALRDVLGGRFQLERTGYFVFDPDGGDEAPVMNRVLPLRDTWGKAQADTPKPSREKKAAAAPRAPAGPSAPRLTEEQAEAAALLGEEHGLPEDLARLLATDEPLGTLFAEGLDADADAVELAKLLANELQRAIREADADPEALPFGGEELAALLLLQAEGALSGRGTKKLLATLVTEGGDPSALVDSLGLRTVQDDGAVEQAVDAVLAAHPDELARYRAGEQKLTGFFMGQVMRAGKGRFDAKAVGPVLKAKLG